MVSIAASESVYDGRWTNANSVIILFPHHCWTDGYVFVVSRLPRPSVLRRWVDASLSDVSIVASDSMKDVRWIDADLSEDFRARAFASLVTIRTCFDEPIVAPERKKMYTVLVRVFPSGCHVRSFGLRWTNAYLSLVSIFEFESPYDDLWTDAD